jgi:hypothetical protein
MRFSGSASLSAKLKKTRGLEMATAKKQANPLGAQRPAFHLGCFFSHVRGGRTDTGTWEYRAILGLDKSRMPGSCAVLHPVHL